MKDIQIIKKFLIFITLFAFPWVVVSVFKPGIFTGHDIGIHILYMRKFYDALVAGQFPVRVIDWFVPGYTMPTFNFYQPGINYLLAFVQFVGFTPELALKTTLSFLWILSGVFMFLLGRKLSNTLGGMLAALLYVFAPYHIVDIFIRAALPEFAALTFIPLLFYGIVLTHERRTIGIVLTAISCFLLVIFHPPTFLMQMPLAITFVSLYLYKKRDVTPFFMVGLALCCGLLLSSFFLLPAFLEHNLTQRELLHTGMYSFKVNFPCIDDLVSFEWQFGASASNCMSMMPLQIGIVHIIVVVLMGIIWLGSKMRASKKYFDSKVEWVDVLLVTFFLIGIFMMLNISEPIWEAAPLLSYFQFPWRFLSLVIFVSSLLSARLILKFKPPVSLIAYSFIGVFCIIAYSGYLKPAYYMPLEESGINQIPFYKDKNMERDELFPILGYLPTTTSVLPVSSGVPKSEIRVLKGKGVIKPLVLKPHQKSYQVDIETKEATVEFSVFYFPGWNVFLNGKKVQQEFSKSLYGYQSVVIPQGEHNVELQFEDSMVRRMANILTFGGTLILFGLYYIGRRLLTRKKGRAYTFK